MPYYFFEKTGLFSLSGAVAVTGTILTLPRGGGKRQFKQMRIVQNGSSWHNDRRPESLRTSGEPKPMYEIFEHTADLGLRVRAATLEELLKDAACGLFAMVVEDLAAVRPAVTREFQIAGSDPALSLVRLAQRAAVCVRYRTAGIFTIRRATYARRPVGRRMRRTVRSGPAPSDARDQGHHLSRLEGRTDEATGGWQR